MSISVTPPFTLTEAEHALLPSESDVEFYAEHGWYLSKKLYTDDEEMLFEAARPILLNGEPPSRASSKQIP